MALKKKIAAKNIQKKSTQKKLDKKAKIGRPKKNIKGQVLDPQTGKFRTGRPASINDSVLYKLAEAFSYGCSDKEACVFAGITPSTLYNYQEKNPEFLEQKECFKNLPTFKARKTIVDTLDKDVENAKWWMKKKRAKEFGDDPSAGLAVQFNNFNSSKYFEKAE